MFRSQESSTPGRRCSRRLQGPIAGFERVRGVLTDTPPRIPVMPSLTLQAAELTPRDR
ncbi:MAG TPA: hypothetical protein VFN67_22730 [Polyangiales bacterium]|nr:hypothetical protein [Polyangiales bacterium]